MEVQKLNKFFAYNPVMNDDPIFLIKKIIHQALQYLPSTVESEIWKAYEFSRDAHAGMLRHSGEPYIVHPIKATEFLMGLKPDLKSIQVCLLHDVIEDTPITYDDITQVFDKEVADLCEGLVKVAKVRYKGEDRHLETLKKTFLAMGKDLRVIFIKLADRIHNVQTLPYHPKLEKRKRIAEETMKIYVPITKRLGLYHFQLYLENGAFRILHEDEFNSIFDYLRKYFGEGEEYTDKGIKILNGFLKKEKVPNFTIKGRIKSPFRVYEKITTRYQGKDLSSIMDLLAFRVITDSVSDCYMVLGIIHKYYTPLIKKIKDYIAVPKFNGYKSIHTTILGMFRFPTEIQIRTKEMDEIAEYGAAAHFGYSENKRSTVISRQQSEWIKKLQDLVSMYKSSSGEKENFKDKLNIEVLEKVTFLYTPEGDIIELPRGGTVLDFAFQIHTEIGLSFKNAMVNREIKPISYVPQTGDIIHINTFKNKYSANKHRMEFLYTPSAKTKLQRFLRTEQKTELVKHSITKLDHNLKQFGLPLFKTKDDQISKYFSEEEMERHLLDTLDKKSNYSQIIKKVYPKEWTFYQNQKQNFKVIPVKNKANIIIDGNDMMSYYPCPECSPTERNKIIAKVGKTGIKIHTMKCKALKTVSFDKLLEAHRQGKNNTSYKATLKIKMDQKHGKIVNVMNIFSQLRMDIIEANIQNTEKNQSVLNIIINVNNPTKISFLLNDLKKYDSSLQVTKRTIE